MIILCFTPLHPDYGIYPETLASIMALEHDDVLDRHFASGDNPFDQGWENVTYHHNQARRMVLAGGYDALLSIEADMVVPPDAISKLIDANADIAYSLYVGRHKPNRWMAYKSLGMWGGASVSLDYTGKDARAAWGNIIDVAGVGMGCTLIHRSVLEQLQFRLHDGNHSWIQEEYADDFRALGTNPYEERKQMVCDDYLLAMDAQHYGLSQRANMSLVCGHIDNDSILWPDPEARKFYRTESIREL